MSSHTTLIYERLFKMNPANDLRPIKLSFLEKHLVPHDTIFGWI